MTVFIANVSSPRRLEAEMATSHVNEAGSENILARVSMEVTEDGMEWATVIDSDGELTERLVNEYVPWRWSMSNRLPGSGTALPRPPPSLMSLPKRASSFQTES